MAKVALGKGLGALINTRVASPTPAVEDGERVQLVALDQIVPSPLQPRTVFRDENLQELVDSIKIHGIIQPLIVRRRAEKFELIAGERRWRAAMRCEIASAPIIVREASDQDVLELALIENLQREDLNPLEEALGYAQLAEQFNLTQEQIATRMGKPRSAVANSLRLLNLSPDIQGYVRKNMLSVGHAKLLLGLPTPADQDQFARDALTAGLSVRALEDLVNARKNTSANTSVSGAHQNGKPARVVVDANISSMQERLQQRLGSKVLLRYRKGKGAIEVRFFNDDDLERILQILGVPLE